MEQHKTNSSALLSSLAVFLGLAAGCGSVIGPSLQADLIDWDEAITQQRKEGTYFAAFNLAFKSATGITLLITGVMLDVLAFVPNQTQTPETVWGLIAQ